MYPEMVGKGVGFRALDKIIRRNGKSTNPPCPDLPGSGLEKTPSPHHIARLGVFSPGRAIQNFSDIYGSVWGRIVAHDVGERRAQQGEKHLFNMGAEKPFNIFL